MIPGGWRGPIYQGQYPEKDEEMSGVLWCDKGDHPFSAKDQFKRHFTSTHEVTVPTGDNYGRPTFQTRDVVHEEIDICGPCWAKDNPFEIVPPTAIEAAEAEAEESAAEMWESKYQAEHAEVLRLRKKS